MFGETFILALSSSAAFLLSDFSGNEKLKLKLKIKISKNWDTVL